MSTRYGFWCVDCETEHQLDECRDFTGLEHILEERQAIAEAEQGLRAILKSHYFNKARTEGNNLLEMAAFFAEHCDCQIAVVDEYRMGQLLMRAHEREGA